MDPRAYEILRQQQDHHWWFRYRATVVAQVISSEAKPKRRFCDIGSGEGANVDFLLAFGAGDFVEPHLPAAQRLTERLAGRATVHGQSLADFAQGRNQGYDLVTMTDVLEHVEDDAGALTLVRSLLAPGGRLVLTVPAHPWLWSAHDVEHHHHRRYSKAILRSRLLSAGYTIHRLSWLYATPFPALVAVRAWSRLRPAVDSTAVMKRSDRSLALTLLRPELAWLRWGLPLPWGSSLLAVAK